MAVNIVTLVEKRRAGCMDPKVLQCRYTSTKIRNMAPCYTKQLEFIHPGEINYLDFDSKEHRFLLVALSEGSIFMYDVQGCSSRTGNENCKLVAFITRSSSLRLNDEFGDNSSCECVQWFPHDPSMFASSGFDMKLRLWDSDRLISVVSASFQEQIMNHHMSPNISQPLIAVASNQHNVLLFDKSSASTTHELKGHSSNVLCCKWSPLNSHLLASGSMDGSVLVWDVRSDRRCLQALTNGSGNAHSHDANALHFTQDGTFLLSCGMDHQLMLWRTTNFVSQKVSYGEVKNYYPKCLQITVTENCGKDFVCIPSEERIRVFDVVGGFPINAVLGHFNRVNSCLYNSHTHDLYSGGLERNILISSPFRP